MIEAAGVAGAQPMPGCWQLGTPLYTGAAAKAGADFGALN
jgi:hypothetical protein